MLRQSGERDDEVKMQKNVATMKKRSPPPPVRPPFGRGIEPRFTETTELKVGESSATSPPPLATFASELTTVSWAAICWLLRSYFYSNSASTTHCPRSVFFRAFCNPATSPLIWSHSFNYGVTCSKAYHRPAQSFALPHQSMFTNQRNSCLLGTSHSSWSKVLPLSSGEVYI